MKTYTIGAWFVISAKNEKEALYQACEMQSAANDSQSDNRRKGLESFLCMDKHNSIKEESWEAILKKGL